LTIQITPQPQNGRQQISTADLQANKQNNFIIIFITQYVKNITSEFVKLKVDA
jgi:hypothetical protein